VNSRSRHYIGIPGSHYPSLRAAFKLFCVEHLSLYVDFSSCRQASCELRLYNLTMARALLTRDSRFPRNYFLLFRQIRCPKIIIKYHAHNIR
jgi:hypothetical protein